MGTIKDIAKYTGLAVSTISKYINGGTVREKNRIRIEDALKIIDYQPNEIARSLKTNKTKTIGILIPNLSSQFDSSIIKNVEILLTEEGYSVIICSYHADSTLERKRLNFLFSKQIDGLIAVPSGLEKEGYEQFLKKRKPVILIDRPVPGLHTDTILTNNREASREATESLIRKKHKNIGLISGFFNIFTFNERYLGYIEAFTEHNIPVSHRLIKQSNWTLNDGYVETCRLLDDNPDLTALIVFSDDLSFGAIKALQEKGKKIPEDISLICFDIYEIGTIIKPTLTVVEQPLDEFGIKASTLLLEKISKGDQPSSIRNILLPSLFLERNSTDINLS